ncbi:MAG: hypothetical protein ACRC1T_05610 [Clostridium chrysemydis]|uniref:hypothetical protein n=1 Tax=Clostridium chrysemydis TaxID=2665504 RepID=UPI003F3BA587
MKQKEYRIYVDGKLENICCNQYVLMCNKINLDKRYGSDKVTIKTFNDVMDDEEKRIWLDGLF